MVKSFFKCQTFLACLLKQLKRGRGKSLEALLSGELAHPAWWPAAIHSHQGLLNVSLSRDLPLGWSSFSRLLRSLPEVGRGLISVPVFPSGVGLEGSHCSVSRLYFALSIAPLCCLFSSPVSDFNSPRPYPSLSFLPLGGGKSNHLCPNSSEVIWESHLLLALTFQTIPHSVPCLSQPF